MSARSLEVFIFTNQTGAATGAQKGWQGGRGLLTVVGTFTGATMTFEHQEPQSETWVQTVTPAGAVISLTAPGDALFELPVTQVRGILTGGTPTGVYATAARVLIG